MSPLETILWWILGIIAAAFALPTIIFLCVRLGTVAYLMAHHHFDKTIEEEKNNGRSTRTKA